MDCVEELNSDKRYALVALITFAFSFLLYVYTLAPSVSTIFDDSLEFQVVAAQLGIAHPTGYPLYTLLARLFTYLPIADVGYRVNLLSAVCGALTTVIVALIVSRISARRVAGLGAGVTLAISPVFWSQSTIAEVYTLNTVFIALTLYLAILWHEARRRSSSTDEGKWFWLMVLAVGLSLTHHRTAAIMVVPLLAFVLVVHRRAVSLHKVPLILVCLVLPQAFYAYLPLRGVVVSSLDGSYHNTLPDFLRYVTAWGYNAFLTGNPLAQHRTLVDYARLFFAQYGLPGLAIAAVGFVFLCRRARPVWLLTTLAFVMYTGFALLYQVADAEVFFIPSFLFIAIWIGFGLALFMDLVARVLALLGPRSAREPVEIAPGSEARDVWQPPSELIANGVAALVVPVLFLVALRPDAIVRYPYNDRSRDWAVFDYGKDMLEQPIERQSVIIGIQGEVTLLRYFQIADDLQRDVTLVAADDEGARREAIAHYLEQGHPVYLTRPLPGISDLYTFSALGPLIRVQKRPGATDVTPDYATDVFFSDSIHLLGYDMDYEQRHWRHSVRLTLFWEVTGPVPTSYKVSARLFDKDGHLVGQTDSFPVHDAYPTSAWQPGEVVRDVYDIPVVPGTPPGLCSVKLVLYQPEDGEEIARTDLRTVFVMGTSQEPPVNELSVDHVLRAEVLDGIQAVGYSLLDRDMLFKQGEGIPLNFLWRLNDGAAKDGVIRVWLDGTDASLVAAIPQWVESASTPRPPGAVLLRQWVNFPLPARVPDGTFSLYVAAYHSEAEAQTGKKPGILLAKCTVKGRDRTFDVPQMQTQVGAILDRKVTLLGFDLHARKAAPGDTFKITVYWQAKTEMDTSYTVFVHLVGSGGAIVGQQDTVPHNGEWPTTGWVQGEVIADEYELSIPDETAPGTYRLIAGMYRADTGQRLTATAGNNNPLGDFVPLTEVSVER